MGEREVLVSSMSLRRDVLVLRYLKRRKRWLVPDHTPPATRVNEHSTCKAGDAEGVSTDV